MIIKSENACNFLGNGQAEPFFMLSQKLKKKSDKTQAVSVYVNYNT